MTKKIILNHNLHNKSQTPSKQTITLDRKDKNTHKRFRLDPQFKPSTHLEQLYAKVKKATIPNQSNGTQINTETVGGYIYYCFDETKFIGMVNKVSILAFVTNASLVDYLFESINRDDVNEFIRVCTKLQALIIRIARFQLKYSFIHYLIQRSRKPVPAIAQKLAYINSELISRTVILRFTQTKTASVKDAVLHVIDSATKKDLKVTVLSTISFLSKSFLELEALLKECLPGLQMGYDVYIPEGYNGGSFYQSTINEALNKIAPKEYQGIETDTYYIIHFLLKPDLFPFTREQHKQLSSYYNELDLIFRFFLVDKPATIDLSPLLSNDRTINIPFSKFIGLTECSNNTFNRMINALNKFTLQTWAVVFTNLTSKRGPLHLV